MYSHIISRAIGAYAPAGIDPFIAKISVQQNIVPLVRGRADVSVHDEAIYYSIAGDAHLKGAVPVIEEGAVVATLEIVDAVVGHFALIQFRIAPGDLVNNRAEAIILLAFLFRGLALRKISSYALARDEILLQMQGGMS